MAKIGRKDPCHCGSGKIYKSCCLAKDEKALRKALAAAATKTCPDAAIEDENEVLCSAALTVLLLVDDGCYDEAEDVALEMLERYPDKYDGYDCLGVVYQAKGDFPQAMEYYRRVLAFIIEQPDLFDSGFLPFYEALMEQLERKCLPN